MNFNKPRPTEYRGVLFRSKSEAIIARAFDMTGIEWEYEPEDLKTSDGWTPDFLTVSKSGSKIVTAAIEYKPCPVTPTYMEELARRFDELNVGLLRGGLSLVVGNPFDPSIPRSRTLYLGDNKWRDRSIVTAPLFSAWDEARNHRFDLR